MKRRTPREIPGHRPRICQGATALNHVDDGVIQRRTSFRARFKHLQIARGDGLQAFVVFLHVYPEFFELQRDLAKAIRAKGSLPRLVLTLKIS